MILGTIGYAEDAEMLVRRYESLQFSQVHRDVLHLFTPRRGCVLDVGAGSGRDAAALARLGHDVVAVEPTAELRERGQNIHASESIEWVDDALPELSALSGVKDFDAILLSAVWMHLDGDERPRAMKRLTALLVSGGRVVITLRHGPVSPGRRMFDVSAEETIRLAGRVGLTMIHRNRRDDLFGRSGVGWSSLGFEWTSRRS